MTNEMIKYLLAYHLSSLCFVVHHAAPEICPKISFVRFLHAEMLSAKSLPKKAVRLQDNTSIIRPQFT